MTRKERAKIINKVEHIFDDLDDLPTTSATTEALYACYRLIDDIMDINVDDGDWMIEAERTAGDMKCEFWWKIHDCLRDREGK